MLGLPRGGVPVAEQVAAAVGANLDVVVARKIGLPGHSEYGIGAITPEGPPIFQQAVLSRAGLREEDLTSAVEQERAEAARRIQRYRGDRAAPSISGKIVIVVDDGLATGVTAVAALREIRRQKPAHLVFAAPVCSREGAETLRAEADAVLCAHVPAQFWAVGQWYTDFEQLSDETVEGILARWSTASEIQIPVNGSQVSATVMRPAHPTGVVLFAHGSGSSRHSPRNRMVAGHLTEGGFTTVLLDLLTPVEAARDEQTAQWRFDIEMLAGRLVSVMTFLKRQPGFEGLPFGLFGASTGAAAALVAAARQPESVRAVVSRGGRPDLAGPALSEVTAPTLLIVGGDDEIVIALNESAAEVLREPAEMVIVPGASHLFTEPGALEQVSEHALDWFSRYLAAAFSVGQ